MNGHKGQEYFTRSVHNVLSYAKIIQTSTAPQPQEPATVTHATRYNPLQMWRDSIRASKTPTALAPGHSLRPPTPRPESVVIEIPEETYRYFVPTFNPFEMLGN